MPNEKKSAASATRNAVSAARGSSTIVPIGDVQLDALGLAHLRQDRVGLVADQVQLHDRADQGHHDLRTRVTAGLDPLRRRLGDRPHLQGEQPGHGQPQTDAAQPEHRVRLVEPLDRRQQRARRPGPPRRVPWQPPP